MYFTDMFSDVRKAQFILCGIQLASLHLHSAIVSQPKNCNRLHLNCLKSCFKLFQLC